MTSLNGGYPIGETWLFDIGIAQIQHDFLAPDEMEYRIVSGARAGEIGRVTTQIVAVQSEIYLVSWQEADRTTVVHLEDFSRGTFLSCRTMPDNEFIRIQGHMRRVSSL